MTGMVWRNLAALALLFASYLAFSIAPTISERFSDSDPSRAVDVCDSAEIEIRFFAVNDQTPRGWVADVTISGLEVAAPNTERPAVLAERDGIVRLLSLRRCSGLAPPVGGALRS